MVLGSHQFSRHANQHTHGSRTHRLSRRHLACSTAPLWHRPIYRQWGIPPRPETAIASVARAIVHASMPRVIYGGGNALEMRPGQVNATTTFSIHAKVMRLSRKARNSNRDTYPQQPRSPPADLKAVNAGNPGAGTGASLRNIPQDAKRLRSAKRDAEPLCMSEDVPERSPRPAPGFPVGVLDLVGLSTYRRPADQR